MPYSSGRVFSLELLKECRFKIFDSRANAWYDTPGLDKGLGYGFPYLLIDANSVNVMGVIQTFVSTNEPDPFLFHGNTFEILYRYEEPLQKLYSLIP